MVVGVVVMAFSLLVRPVMVSKVAELV